MSAARNNPTAAPVVIALGLTLAGFFGFQLSRPNEDTMRDGAITPVTRIPSAAMMRGQGDGHRHTPGEAPHGDAGDAASSAGAPDDDVHAGVRGGAPRRIPTHGENPGGQPPDDAVHGAASGRRAPDDAVHAGVARAPAAPAAAPGMPPMGGAAAETDGDPDLPLKKTGINSAEELARGRAAAGASEEARTAFERGFRLTFTTRQDRRGYAEAVTLLQRAISLEPNLAEAYRALGYAVFNTGGGFDGAIPLYRKAVEIRPTYGEAHYALAFFLGESDRATGRTHFRRAKELGVPDERGLGPRYYPDVN